MSAEPQLFRIDPETRESESITEVEFAALGFQERRDIQEWVAANPSIVGDNLLIISKEFSGFDRTNERLDLLAIEPDGTLVVIELKRDDTGSDAHWQAIKYASYFRHAQDDSIIRMLAAYKDISEEDAGGLLLRHLGGEDINSLNHNQRIILASHRFAPEVTSAVLWLNEKAPSNNLITCIKLVPYRDSTTDTLYVQANTIIPTPGMEEYMVGVGGSALQEDGNGNRAVNLRKTVDRNKNDEVTRFFRGVADLAIENLPSELMPDKKSRWAGGWAGGALDHRFYRLWYSNQPWSRHFSHKTKLYREDETTRWRVNVEFSPLSEDLRIEMKEKGTLKALGMKLRESGIEEEARTENESVVLTQFSDALDDNFAKSLAVTLRQFIEVITPLVDEFYDELSNQEDA